MTLKVAPSIPTLIRPDQGGVYWLDGRACRLVNGLGSFLTINLVNSGSSPATVAGTIAGAAGALVIEPGTAFMLGWDVHGTAWRALRMCEAEILGPEDDTPAGPHPADGDFLVEGLDGVMSRASLPTIAAFLAGNLPTLAGYHLPPAWSPS